MIIFRTYKFRVRDFINTNNMIKLYYYLLSQRSTIPQFQNQNLTCCQLHHETIIKLVLTITLHFISYNINYLVAETGIEPVRTMRFIGFSYHTCFYTSKLIEFLWSGLFEYHIWNVATYNYSHNLSKLV